MLSSVTLSPSSVTGGSSSTGTVTLTAAAASGGAIVTLTSATPATAQVPSSVTVAAGSTSATFTVTTTAVTAATNVSITGNFGGSASATLSVNPPPGTQIAVKFTGGAPLAVAQQIGAGNWAAASLKNGSLNLTVPAGTSTYGIAYVCPTWQGMGPVSSEYAIYATTQDATSFTVSCFVNPTLATVTGNFDVSAIATATQAQIYASEFFSQTVSGVSGAFSFQAPKGTNDIAVVALDASGNPVGVKIVRNQTVPGAVSGTITLASTDATSVQNMSDAGIPTGFLPNPAGPYAEYFTANNTAFYAANTSVNTQYSVVPASEAQSGDYYFFTSNDAGGSNQHVYATQTTTAGAAETLTFPTPLPAVSPAPAKFPSFTVAYSGFSGDAAVSYSANVQWQISGTDYGITATATSAYQNGASTLVIPDLTSLSGFLAMATSGTTVDWQVYVYGGSYQWFTPTPASGTLSFVQNQGSYTEP